MEFKEVVESRYSCKKYSDKKVEREKLEAVLEAGSLLQLLRTCRNNTCTCWNQKEALDKFGY